jgi:hypothetical protein
MKEKEKKQKLVFLYHFTYPILLYSLFLGFKQVDHKDRVFLCFEEESRFL